MATFQKKYTTLDIKEFDRCMGQYRTKVYESYVWKESTESDIMAIEKITHIPTEKSTILVVENNADEWFLIRWTLLQLFPQTQAVWLSDSDEVDTYLKTCAQSDQSLPKLVLLDLYLPNSQVGLSLLQTFKSHPLYQQIPVVMLSWSNATDDIIDALAMRLMAI